MSNRMKYAKIKNENGEITATIPIAVDAVNVDLSNGQTLETLAQTLTTNVGTLTTNVGTLTTNVGTLTTNVETLTEKMEALEYKSIKIESFTINPSVVEKGSIVNSVTCSYNFSKVPTSASIGVRVNNQTNYNNVKTFTTKTGTESITDYSYTSDSTFTLSGIDTGAPGITPVPATATATLAFRSYYFYGVAGQSAVNKTLLDGLQNHPFATSKVKNDITLTPNANQYIWIAFPADWGTPTFVVDGSLTGGFILAGTFSYENSSNYPESYQVWRSQKKGLGRTMIDVK